MITCLREPKNLVFLYFLSIPHLNFRVKVNCEEMLGFNLGCLGE